MFRNLATCARLPVVDFEPLRNTGSITAASTASTTRTARAGTSARLRCCGEVRRRVRAAPLCTEKRWPIMCSLNFWSISVSAGMSDRMALAIGSSASNPSSTVILLFNLLLLNTFILPLEEAVERAAFCQPLQLVKPSQYPLGRRALGDPERLRYLLHSQPHEVPQAHRLLILERQLLDERDQDHVEVRALQVVLRPESLRRRLVFQRRLPSPAFAPVEVRHAVGGDTVDPGSERSPRLVEGLQVHDDLLEDYRRDVLGILYRPDPLEDEVVDLRDVMVAQPLQGLGRFHRFAHQLSGYRGLPFYHSESARVLPGLYAPAGHEIPQLLASPFSPVCHHDII